MNSKLLLTLFITLLTVATTCAQISAKQAGIAVQGIARDNSNTAITTGDPIDFKFTIYYKTTQEYVIHSEDVQLTTDLFGVFSHVIDVDYNQNSAFSHNQTYLRIEAGSPKFVISDEKLNHVPYAISANNGVPMGSIMPFLGTVAPPGWLLCHGQGWNEAGNAADNLKAFLGTATVPDLRGRFLKGAGVQTGGPNNIEAVQLNDMQAQSLQNHKHGKGTLKTEMTSAFTEDGQAVNDGLITYNKVGYAGMLVDIGSPTTPAQVLTMPKEETYWVTNTLHEHTITGETEDSGDTTENRPNNYGVNYIIKL